MAPPRGKKGNVDFPKMVGAGENPNGFTSQTANGTVHDTGGGDNQGNWRYRQQADGERWNGPQSQPFDFGGSRPTRQSGPTRRGRANRTGE